MMKTGFSLWELAHREFPVSYTGFGFTVWFLAVLARLVILISIFDVASHVQMIISEGLQIVLQNCKGNQNIFNIKYECVLGGNAKVSSHS